MRIKQISSINGTNHHLSHRGIHKINLSASGVINEFDNIHLDDKVSAILKNLKKGDFLVVSPDKGSSLKKLKVLSALEGSLKGTIYHIQNNKFKETAIFGVNSQKGGIDFINLNDESVRVNTIPVKSYYGISVKNGDRIWGSNMRSILIKSAPDIPAELEKKYELMVDRYDYSEINNISAEVHYRPTTTNHIH